MQVSEDVAGGRCGCVCGAGVRPFRAAVGQQESGVFDHEVVLADETVLACGRVAFEGRLVG